MSSIQITTLFLTVNINNEETSDVQWIHMSSFAMLEHIKG
jgi:hypothetical protein